MLSIDKLGLKQRHIKKVKVTDTCWLWNGGITSSGYGSILENYKYYSTHRYFYIKAFGPINDGLHVLHKCDVRNCVNPEHLFLGTNLDNIRDAIKKGRKTWRRKSLKLYCSGGHRYINGSFRNGPNNARICKECEKIRSKNKRKKLKWKMEGQQATSQNIVNCL